MKVLSYEDLYRMKPGTKLIVVHPPDETTHRKDIYQFVTKGKLVVLDTVVDDRISLVGVPEGRFFYHRFALANPYSNGVLRDGGNV